MSEENELVAMPSRNTIMKMSGKQLSTFAEEKANQILAKVEESSTRIAEAKQASEEAQDMQIHMFGIGTKKKANATANALVKTNEALAQMNDLIQASIGLICISAAFAQEMYNSLQEKMTQGFEDTDGNLHQITEESQKFVGQILDETESYIEKQKEIEKQQKDIKSIKKAVGTPLWLGIITFLISIAAIILAIKK